MTREEAIKYLKAWNPIHPLKQEARDMAVEALKQTEIAESTLELLKEQDKTIGQLEEELARTDDMLRHYLNGNE